MADDSRPPLGFLIVRIAEVVDREFVAALAGIGLKARDLRLLVLVNREPGLNQRKLAHQLGIDAGNLVAILDSLEGEGLLERARDPADRRQRLVTLTAEGRRILAEGVRATEAVEERMFGPLPNAERRLFYETALGVYLETAGRGG